MFEVEKNEILIEFLEDIRENFNNGMSSVIEEHDREMLLHKECELLRNQFREGILTSDEFKKMTIEAINRCKEVKGD